MSDIESLPSNETGATLLLKKICQRILTLAILCILFLTIIAGTSESLHSQMLSWGGAIWEDYFILRGEEPTADCDLKFDIARLSIPQS